MVFSPPKPLMDVPHRPAKERRVELLPSPAACLTSDEPVDQVLEIFLLPRARLGIDVVLEHPGRNLLEAALARQHGLGLALVPAGIALLTRRLERAVIEDRRRCL